MKLNNNNKLKITGVKSNVYEDVSAFNDIFNYSYAVKDKTEKEENYKFRENQLNLSLYLLNYLKSIEYYKLVLLGQTKFEFSFDTSDTIDNYLYGVNSISMKFEISNELIQIGTYLNLGDLLKKVTITDLELYVDVKFLQTKNIMWSTSTFTNANTSLIVNSDVNKEYNKKLFLDFGFKKYDFQIDLSKYFWEKGKHVLKNNLDLYLTLPGDKSDLLIQFIVNSEKDLNTISKLYESDLTVSLYLKNETLLTNMIKMMSDLNKGSGHKYLYLNKSFSLFSSESFYDEKVGKLNRNIIHLYKYFDDIYNS